MTFDDTLCVTCNHKRSDHEEEGDNAYCYGNVAKCKCKRFVSPLLAVETTETEGSD